MASDTLQPCKYRNHAASSFYYLWEWTRSHISLKSRGGGEVRGSLRSRDKGEPKACWTTHVIFQAPRCDTGSMIGIPAIVLALKLLESQMSGYPQPQPLTSCQRHSRTVTSTIWAQTNS